MFRRHAIVAVVAVPLVAMLTPGCSDDTKATPQIIFESDILHGTGNDCREDGQLFLVGDFGNPNATPPVASDPIPDGKPFGQGTVSVACSVTAAGADSFNVAASVELTGATGGLFRIDGVFKTSGDQANIHAIFTSNLSKNSYEETDRQCTVRYATPFQGVAAGRVWGQIDCPHIDNQSAQTSCEGTAQFRFENCAQ